MVLSFKGTGLMLRASMTRLKQLQMHQNLGISRSEYPGALLIPWFIELLWKFVPYLTTSVHPLKILLQHKKKWDWMTTCSHAFSETKQALMSASILAHYDASLPLMLAGDASAYGIGAVISHRLPDST